MAHLSVPPSACFPASSVFALRASFVTRVLFVCTHVPVCLLLWWLQALGLICRSLQEKRENKNQFLRRRKQCRLALGGQCGKEADQELPLCPAFHHSRCSLWFFQTHLTRDCHPHRGRAHTGADSLVPLVPSTRPACNSILR